MDNPLFTIVTVTFNARETIERTLKSVASQLYGNYEHLIVDGASTDGTFELVATFPRQECLRLISEPDKGLYDAMNKGIMNARGEFLIFLNAGDKFHSTTSLDEIAKSIEQNKGVDIVYGQTNLVDDEGKFIGPRHLTAPDNLKVDDFAQGMLVCHQAFVARRAIVPQYSLKYRYSADYEWCIKCLEKSGGNIYTGSVLIDYLSEGMTTANRRKSLIERFKIMSEYYGFWPTVFRHFGFLVRFMRNR